MPRFNVKHSGLALAIGAMLLLTPEVPFGKEMSVDGGGPDRPGSSADRGARSDRTERTTPAPAAVSNGPKAETAAAKPAPATRGSKAETAAQKPAATGGSKTEAAAPKPAETKSDAEKALSKGASIAGRFAAGRMIGGAIGGFIAGGPVGAAVGVFLTSSDAK